MIEFREEKKCMGTQFELVIHHSDENFAQKMLEEGYSEIERIEDLLSEFRSHSQVSKINHLAGAEAAIVDEEVLNLFLRSHKISEITSGAFDISVGPLKKIYRFKNELFSMPSADVIKDTLLNVGYQNIEIAQEKQEVYLKKKNMFVSFAAIGKGYAADRVKKMWLNNGVQSAVVSASGDLTTIGSKMDGSPWKIGIANPQLKNEMLFYIPVSNASVATSGDYEQYFMHDGIRYSHTINPKTGRPVSGIKSVSVVSQSAELSDALATAVYVIGIEVGLHLINQLPHIHALIIDDKDKVWGSKDIQIEKNA